MYGDAAWLSEDSGWSERLLGPDFCGTGNPTLFGIWRRAPDSRIPGLPDYRTPRLPDSQTPSFKGGRPLAPALRIFLRAPGGSPVTHGGLRAWGVSGPHGGPPYVTHILRAGPRGVISVQTGTSKLQSSHGDGRLRAKGYTIMQSC
jgi:hypothetical protein